MNPCPPGSYGSTYGLTSPTCTSLCNPVRCVAALFFHRTSAISLGLLVWPRFNIRDTSALCCTAVNADSCVQNPCPMGTWGNGGSSSAACAGSNSPCPAHVFADFFLCASPAAGTCTANYYCPPASTSPTANACPSGSSSSPGAGALTDCICLAGYGSRMA